MDDDYKFNYLMNFKMKRCLEVAQKYVSRNEFFSSNIWTSFQEKLKCALMSVSREVTAVAELFKMVHNW